MTIIPLSALEPPARPAARLREPKPAYEIGYGKPPTNSKFRKGQSGNPRGRPKLAKGLNTIVREVMLAKVSVRTSSGERRISRAEALVLKNLELATKGNSRAVEQLLRWFQAAVPDQTRPPEAEAHCDPSPADQAILDQLLADMREKIEGAAGAPDE